MRRVVAMAVVWSIGWAAAASAEDPPTATPTPAATPTVRPRSAFVSQFNLEARLDEAANNLTRRYNLTPEQDRWARDEMRRLVYGLLDQHEVELRKVLTEVVAVQFSGRPPTAAQAQAWAERSGPIFEDIRAAVMSGNEAFHAQLNDEQKKVHDTDMAETTRNFTQFGEKLARWKDGGFKPEDWTAPRQASTQPANGESGSAGAGAKVRGPEHFWALYTNNFVRDYDLDPAQAAAAQAILKDVVGRAEQLRAGRAAQLAALDAKIDSLSTAAQPDGAALKAALEQRRDLVKPISDLLGELKSRLEKLPTQAQREKFEARMRARAGEHNQAVRGSASQPATSP